MIFSINYDKFTERTHHHFQFGDAIKSEAVHEKELIDFVGRICSFYRCWLEASAQHHLSDAKIEVNIEVRDDLL